MKKLLSVGLLLLLSLSAFSQEISSESEKAKKLPRLLDFGSKQCKACKAMEVVLEACKAKHSDEFDTEFIDVWKSENQTFAQDHQIQSIPTQVFFNEEGKEIFRHTGFISEEAILAKWAELGIIFSSEPDNEKQSDSSDAKEEKPVEEIPE